MKLLLTTIFFFICFFQSFSQIGFDKNKPFTILHSKRGITRQSSATDTLACKDWLIPQKALSKIIRNCKLISGTEWDLTFDVLPCIITGKLKQNGKIYQFEINAGSWLYVFANGKSIILGDYNKSDKKYFVSFPDN
ncbi:MAG: hypothetical protein ABI091_02540 [Ferruginibacter sp.]